MLVWGIICSRRSGRLDQPGLYLVISHHAQLDWLAQAEPAPYPPTVWLCFAGDIRHTGENYRAAYGIAVALVKGVRHLNHYARADEAEGIAASTVAFRAVTEDLSGPVSTCNSATVLRHSYVYLSYCP